MNRVLVAALATVLAGGFFAACSSPAATPSSEAPAASEPAATQPAAEPSAPAEETVDGIAGPLKPYDGEGKVGFAIYNGTVPHWNRDDIPDLQTCLDDYAPNVELVTADPRADAQKQTSQVQSMIAQGINVLLIAPVAATPSGILSAAKAANVKVINYANPVIDAQEGEVIALVGDGPEPIGRAQGQWLLDQNLPKGSEIGLINGDLATQYAQLMRVGQLAVLQPAIDAGDLKLVVDKGAKNFDPAEAEKIAQAALVANPNIAGFIVATDPEANAVINAIQNAGVKQKIKMIGLDGDPVGVQNILLGKMDATVIKSSHDEMRVGCVATIAALRGDPIPTDVFTETWDLDTAPMPFVDVPVEVIDITNLQNAIDKGILTLEEACSGLPDDIGNICAK
jgi:D-xylose transport system substrate-binding protein